MESTLKINNACVCVAELSLESLIIGNRKCFGCSPSQDQNLLIITPLLKGSFSLWLYCHWGGGGESGRGGRKPGITITI